MSGAGSGSGVGHGGGAGGSIREAGGAIGMLGAAREEEYFRRQQKEQLDTLKSKLQADMSQRQKEVENHNKVSQGYSSNRGIILRRCHVVTLHASLSHAADSHRLANGVFKNWLQNINGDSSQIFLHNWPWYVATTDERALWKDR